MGQRHSVLPRLHLKIIQTNIKNGKKKAWANSHADFSLKFLFAISALDYGLIFKLFIEASGSSLHVCVYPESTDSEAKSAYYYPT